jgi:hypothetical protein
LVRRKRGHLISREPTTIMGYTITDTVSCRLLPSQIAELRELAAAEGVSLSRFVSGLCIKAIQDRQQSKTQTARLEDAPDPAC